MRAILKKISGLALGLVMLGAMAVQAGASPRGTVYTAPQSFRVMVGRRHHYHHRRYWYWRHHHRYYWNR